MAEGINRKPFYVMVPISYIPGLYTSSRRESIEKMLLFGIYNYAMKISDFTLEDAYRTVIYEYYKTDEGFLTHEITGMLDNLVLNEDVYYDEDHKGFDGNGEYCAYDELDSLIDYQNEIDDWGVSRFPDIEHPVMEFAKVKLAAEKATIELSKGIIERIIALGRVENEKQKGVPMFSITVTTLWEFLTKEKSHTYADYCELAMLCGIRSIIGAKDMAVTNRSFILARSLGCRNVEQCEEMCKGKKAFRDLHSELSSRRIYEAHINALEAKGFIHTLHIPGERCIYIGVKGEDNLEQAIIEHKKKKSNKQLKRNIKKKHEDMLDRVLTTINRNTT